MNCWERFAKAHDTYYRAMNDRKVSYHGFVWAEQELDLATAMCDRASRNIAAALTCVATRTAADLEWMDVLTPMTLDVGYLPRLRLELEQHRTTAKCLGEWFGEWRPQTEEGKAAKRAFERIVGEFGPDCEARPHLKTLFVNGRAHAWNRDGITHKQIVELTGLKGDLTVTWFVRRPDGTRCGYVHGDAEIAVEHGMVINATQTGNA